MAYLIVADPAVLAVEVRATGFLVNFGVPDGSEAVIFSGPREAFCMLDPPEDER